MLPNKPTSEPGFTQLTADVRVQLRDRLTIKSLGAKLVKLLEDVNSSLEAFKTNKLDAQNAQCSLSFEGKVTPITDTWLLLHFVVPRE